MKKIINSSNAPKPIGPYSQAVLKGDTLFVSGQIPINPASRELVAGDIKAEAKQVMENIKAILTEAEMDFSNVCKSSIFLKNLDDFALVNEIYGSYLSRDYPARETVQVSKLPLDVNVEISVIAMK